MTMASRKQPAQFSQNTPLSKMLDNASLISIVVMAINERRQNIHSPTRTLSLTQCEVSVSHSGKGIEVRVRESTSHRSAMERRLRSLVTESASIAPGYAPLPGTESKDWRTPDQAARYEELRKEIVDLEAKMGSSAIDQLMILDIDTCNDILSTIASKVASRVV